MYSRYLFCVLIALLVLYGCSSEQPQQNISYDPVYGIPSQLIENKGWKNISWDDPGEWVTIDVTTRGITPGMDDAALALDELIGELSMRPEHVILYFPEGTYDFKRGYVLINTNNIIIKGAGPDKTIFRLHENFSEIRFDNSQEYEEETDIVKDTPVLGSKIYPEHTDNLHVGDIIKITQELETYDEEWGRRASGGVFVIEDVDTQENSITVNLPLPSGLELGNEPVLYKLKPVRNVGFENIYIERTASNNKSGIIFNRVYNGYIKDIESSNSSRHHIEIVSSSNVIVSDSFIHDARNKGEGGFGYGVIVEDLSTRVLVTNNIIKDVRHYIVVQTGANHCVFSYNYDIDSERDRCLTNLYPECDNYTGYIVANNISRNSDISVHGHYPHTLLFEGNVFYYAELDDVWGDNGPDITFFRNYIKGQPAQYGNWREGEGIHITPSSNGEFIIGNYFAHESVLVFADRLKERASFIGANVIKNVTEWNDSSYKRGIPQSLYLDSPPGFWTSGLGWPAFGPDIQNNNGNKIPAQIRYEEMKNNK